MEPSLIAFLCLSAVMCIAHCQTPDCPQEVLDDPLRFSRSQHLNIRLLERQQCQYLARRAFAGIPFGTPTVVRRTYYTCIEGFEPLIIAHVRGRPLYLCEQGEIVVPDDTPEEPEEPEEPEVPVDVFTERPTQGDSASSGETTRPEADRRPTSEPATVDAPTEADTDDVPRCPSSRGFSTSNYLPSSLGRIEKKPCYISTRVQGSQPMKRESFFWDCKDRYTRTHVRRDTYKCE